jgi:tripartite-type tricarboxylate transporter receptor subunit TctC
MSASRFLMVLLLTALCGVVTAQDWPSKPVKFVSPYPPGGSVDPLARLLGAKLGDSLKQNFIVENRTGASGIIGTEYVAKSAPDG